jgi:ADP-ribose pyrophosphatase YjhB (NUDIX family)
VYIVFNNDANTWSFPGGAVELNETLKQAIIREVKEKQTYSYK